ncbi:Laminin G domain family protein [Acanthocheilonema viteae]
MIIRRSSTDRNMCSYMKMHGLAKRLPNSRFRMRMQMIPQCESIDTSTSIVNNSVPLRNFQQEYIHSSADHLNNDRHIKVISRNLKISQNSILWWLLLIILYTSVVAVVKGQELSQLFLGSYPSQSRFLNFAGKSQRDIVVRLTKNLTEDTPVGTLIATFRAEDKDSMTHNLTFRINRQTDPKRQFSIDQSGSLCVAQRLDREEIPKYNLVVEAFDSAGNVGFQTIEIYVQDVNDNAPVPYTIPNPCVFMENTDPTMQPTCEIRAYDPDTIENGPPFMMKLASDFKFGAYLNVVYNKNGDNGNGSMTVTAKQRLDREAEFPGKQLEIPIILKDSGGLQSERSVYIIIGDENDSPMRDGEMTIFVNSYLGHLGKTVIGRVYVEDKDDWDLPDKVFSWAAGKSLPGFSLAINGEITMDANMPPRTYQMIANVVDKRRNEKAQGVVNVIIKKVPAAAFENQGAIRIMLSPNGLHSPDSFIRIDSTGSSPMSRFVNKMNEYLDGNSELDVFSIKQDQMVLQNYAPTVLDVRFSAHGTPYKSPILLNGLIAQYRSELEHAIGATIVSAGIDMCKFTVCDKGCQTVHHANEEGIVVSANQTVVVGVNAWSNDTCICPIFTPPSSCQPNLCLNSGVCHNTYPGFFCECRNNFLKGLRCQGTTRSFDGEGFAWFKPVPACTSLNISLQFLTRQANGLLLYNGPMGRDNNTDYKDYVIIRLVGGRIQADFMFNGIVANPIQIPGSDTLNDGKWHTVTLSQDGKIIELVIDNCYTIVPIGTGDKIIRIDDSSCRRVKITADDDERLNVVTPLQIGGVAPLSGNDRYPGIVTAFAMNFKGCIRDLVVNNELYDLGVPDYASEEHSQIGCQLTDGACGLNDISGPYCIHGECISDLVSNVPKCLCDPGYGGDRCDSLFKWVEFGPGSFVEYDVKVGLEDKTTNVDLLFLPGKANAGTGELGFASAGEKYISTSIENYSPTAKFDFSSSPGATVSGTSVELQLTDLHLQDNISYWMQLSRNPFRASLSIDGVYHNVLPLNPLKIPYQIDINELFLGALNVQSAKGFRGCVGTFRWQHINLPLMKSDELSSDDHSQSDSDSIISVKQSKGVENGCSQRKTCANVGFAYCGGSFVCVDFWKGPFCTCPEGAQVLLGVNGELIGCGETLAVSSLGISSPAIILILICLILLIMMVLLMIVYTRRHTPPFEPVRPEELNRDNLRPYDIEGGGEADNDQYNITNLRKPVMPIEENGINGYAQPVYPMQRSPIDDKLNNRIKNLEADPDATAPYDELRIYDDEGDNISRITLESLESNDDAIPSGNLDQEIEKWGPRFNNLADIYGKREK